MKSVVQTSVIGSKSLGNFDFVWGRGYVMNTCKAELFCSLGMQACQTGRDYLVGSPHFSKLDVKTLAGRGLKLIVVELLGSVRMFLISSLYVRPL